MKHANLFLVRHGETKWNAEKRIQGSLDSSLNEQGKKQVHAIGRHFSKIKMHALYSSPQIRAKESAEILKQYHAHEVRFEEALRERSWGVGEGLTRDEFAIRFAKELEHMYSLSKEERHKGRYIEGSESTHDLELRVMPCLHRIAGRHKGENVLVVTHGWVIKALFLIIDGQDVRDFYVKNGGYVHLLGDGKILQILKCEGIETK